MAYIQLDEAPERLREVVRNRLDSYDFARLLCVERYETTPYKDKTLIVINYRAYVQIVNWFEVYRFEECSKPEWSDQEVRSSGMIAAEIIEFLKHSELLQMGAEKIFKI